MRPASPPRARRRQPRPAGGTAAPASRRRAARSGPGPPAAARGSAPASRRGPSAHSDLQSRSPRPVRTRVPSPPSDSLPLSAHGDRDWSRASRRDFRLSGVRELLRREGAARLLARRGRGGGWAAPIALTADPEPVSSPRHKGQPCRDCCLSPQACCSFPFPGREDDISTP